MVKRRVPIVLNLVISGIPSILTETIKEFDNTLASFKPCYKWNTFNTMVFDKENEKDHFTF